MKYSLYILIGGGPGRITNDIDTLSEPKIVRMPSAIHTYGRLANYDSTATLKTYHKVNAMFMA